MRQHHPLCGRVESEFISILIIDNCYTTRIGAGGLGSINIAEANMAAYLTNIDEAVQLTAALDCGRIESIRCWNHINHDHKQ